MPGVGGQTATEEQPRIQVVKLTTIFYKLQNSDLIQEHLSADIKKTMKIELQTEEVIADLGNTEEVMADDQNGESKAKPSQRFAQYEAQLEQLLKFVFFENRQAQGIPLDQLMKDLTQMEQQQQQHGMMGMEGMEGMEDLLGQFGGGDGEENGDEMQMIQKLLGGLTQQPQRQNSS